MSPSNLSKTFFCPNPKSCPGGAVSFMVSAQPSENWMLGDMPTASTPMCAEGYVGDGCVSCNKANFELWGSRSVLVAFELAEFCWRCLACEFCLSCLRL